MKHTTPTFKVALALAMGCMLGSPAIAQEEGGASETKIPKGEKPLKEGKKGKKKAAADDGPYVPSPWAVIDDGSKLAFEVYLEGSEAPPIRVTEKYWDELLGWYRGLHGIENQSQFVYKMLGEMFRVFTMRLYYYDKLPGLEKRANQIIRKLKRGQLFSKMVKAYTENSTARPLGGAFGQVTVGMMNYPVERELFRLEKGEVSQPLFTMFGVEIYIADQLTGDKTTIHQVVGGRSIMLKYHQGHHLTGSERTGLNRRMRVRCDNPRFQCILPPGRFETTPTTFGPSDVAPIGAPKKPLVQVSDLDALKKDAESKDEKSGGE